ncbi:hypothetical protein [Patulibacter defluvii]|uniref:hypothetical protein n=1 Tax=Patulibacter defluvii TaxID=3095358 RepID=UPI002A75E74B|nr:hypothetical protein [Patulibacter sp. DM4]
MGGAVLLALLAASGPAAAAVPAPRSPADQTIRTLTGWTVSVHGPDTVAENAKVSTEIAIRDFSGQVTDVLYPETDLESEGCRPKQRPNCVPARVAPGPPKLIGELGLVVQDNLRDPPGVIVQMKRAGDHCCQLLVGYVPDPAGGYSVATLNAGGERLLSVDQVSRIRVGNQAWETLDWRWRAHQPNYRWVSLDEDGWIDVTSDEQHHAELRRLTRALRKARTAGAARSTRAVIISHVQALGEKARAEKLLRSYRRRYGKTPAARLQTLLAVQRESEDGASERIARARAATRPAAWDAR